MVGRPRTQTAQREYSSAEIAQALKDAEAHAAEGARLFKLLRDMALDLSDRNFPSRSEASRHLGMSVQSFGSRIIHPRAKTLPSLVAIVRRLQGGAKSAKKN